MDKDKCPSPIPFPSQRSGKETKAQEDKSLAGVLGQNELGPQLHMLRPDSDSPGLGVVLGGPHVGILLLGISAVGHVGVPGQAAVSRFRTAWHLLWAFTEDSAVSHSERLALSGQRGRAWGRGRRCLE